MARIDLLKVLKSPARRPEAGLESADQVHFLLRCCTLRQRYILHKIAAGRTITQIARFLGCSRGRVRRTVSSVGRRAWHED
jgi:DNA-binding NarL/FixJ family response regulator